MRPLTNNPDLKFTDILWVTPKWPWPPQDGARVATVKLVSDLSPLCQSQGMRLHLLSIAGRSEIVNSEQELAAKLGIERVICVPRPETDSKSFSARMRMLSHWFFRADVPLTMRNYDGEAIDKAVRSAISPRPTIIVYDGLHPAIHAFSRGSYRKPEGTRVVYRAHNREADLWWRKARLASRADAPLTLRSTAWIFRQQARMVQAVEDSLVEAASCVAAVSQEDLDEFRRFVPGLKGEVIPIGVSFDEPPPPPVVLPGSLPLLFIGRLDWPPNREGLEWFLERVWPQAVVRRPGLELEIAGSGDGSWISRWLNQPGIRFLGRAESVDPLYARAALSLVPVFYGSGTRVKAIEACRFARPCLSTALGVEGVGLVEGESYLRAETERDWVDALLKAELSTLARMGQAARESARARFDSSRVAEKFMNKCILGT